MSLQLTTKWVKYNRKKFPDEEVLAVGHQMEFIVGWLNDQAECESDGELLTHVTHYIPVSQLKEQLKSTSH